MAAHGWGSLSWLRHVSKTARGGARSTQSTVANGTARVVSTSFSTLLVPPPVGKGGEEEKAAPSPGAHLEAELREGGGAALAHLVQIDQKRRDALPARREEGDGVERVAQADRVLVPARSRVRKGHPSAGRSLETWGLRLGGGKRRGLEARLAHSVYSCPAV